MIFTIEPGLYKEGEFGVRLENTVYFHNNKKLLSRNFPYEENLVNYDMLTKKRAKMALKIWQEGKMND